jgi:hypothetical protein
MTVFANNFQNDIILLGKKNAKYPTLAAELNAIVAALGTDVTTHDLTITNPPAALKPAANKTPFTNEALLIVNKGKAGNLANSVMAAQISAALGTILVPVNTVAPVVSGTATVGSVLTSTTGTWLYSATSYQYQWRRNGTVISNAAVTYTTVAADSGTNISCAVFAFNTAGRSLAAAISNNIAIA